MKKCIYYSCLLDSAAYLSASIFVFVDQKGSYVFVNFFITECVCYDCIDDMANVSVMKKKNIKIFLLIWATGQFVAEQCVAYIVVKKKGEGEGVRVGEGVGEGEGGWVRVRVWG
jgi:hypothetical protein